MSPLFSVMGTAVGIVKIKHSVHPDDVIPSDGVGVAGGTVLPESVGPSVLPVSGSGVGVLLFTLVMVVMAVGVTPIVV